MAFRDRNVFGVFEKRAPGVKAKETCGPIGYGFLGGFFLNGVSISSLFVLNRVSSHVLMA